MPSGKHFVVLVPGFPIDEEDDSCLPYFQDFLQVFAARRPDCTFTIISFQYPFEARTYTCLGREVHAMGGKNRRWLKPVIWLKVRNTFRRIHARRPVDGILSLWLSETALLGEKLSRQYSIRHVASALGQDVLPSNAYLKRLDLSRCPIVALSAQSAAALTQNRGWNARAILPFAEPSSSLRIPPPEHKRDIDILGVGSLLPLKRYDRFLDVVSLLAAKHPTVRVVLIGDGPERNKLESKAKELNLEKNLQFLGRQNRKSTLEWMRRSKVLLHTSEQEGQGYVFTEALNRGLYLVSSACGMASHSEEWAVCEDIGQMAEAVERFWGMPEPDLSRRIRANEESQGRMVEGYLTLLEDEVE